jgi:hypothetical protein
MLEPVPAEVPPHEPVNHSHVAPVPKLPPVTVRVLEVPEQVLLLVIETPVGAVDWLPTVTASVFAELVPQLLPAVTLIFPFCPAVPVVTIIEVDPCPPVIVQPEGADHVYVVAPATADILYVCPVRAGHCAVTPDIVPGWEGMPGCTVTPRVLAVLVPQLFPAVTLISPFCPAVPVVTDIEVDPCPPVIDQPEGTFHVYVVAPATTEML